MAHTPRAHWIAPFWNICTGNREDAQLPAYDTVLGALREGKELYAGAGVIDKNHIQICVRNEQCIRGYFRVRELAGEDLSRWDRHPLRARPSATAKSDTEPILRL